MSRPLSQSSYQPRWSSPLTHPPLQDNEAPSQYGRSKYDFRGTPYRLQPGPSLGDGAKLARSSGYSRGKHGRTISAPPIPVGSSTPLPSTLLRPPQSPPSTMNQPRPLTNPHLRRAEPIFSPPDPSSKQFELHRPRFTSDAGFSVDSTPALEARLSGTTEFRTKFHVSAYDKDAGTLHSAPPRLQYTHHDPTKEGNRVSLNRTLRKSLPPDIALPQQPAKTVGSRRPVVAPRPVSDFKSKDDESRDLLSRMAAHSRSLSAEPRYQVVTPRINAPREGASRGTSLDQARRYSGARMSMEGSQSVDQVPQRHSGMRCSTASLPIAEDHGYPNDERTAKKDFLWYITACFGHQDDTPNSDQRDRYPEPPRISELPASRQPSLRINLNADIQGANRRGDTYTTRVAAPAMSKLRGLRLVRKQRQTSQISDVPLTTIQPPTPLDTLNRNID